jgi:hypothetical protein
MGLHDHRGRYPIDTPADGSPQKGFLELIPESQTAAALMSSCDVMLSSFGSFLRGPNPEDGGSIFL